MKILMVCHSLQIRSEWLFRLIDNFKDNIGCIAANETNNERVSIDQKSLNPFYTKLIRRANEAINQKFIYPKILKGIEEKYHTDLNYFHFLSFAVNFLEFIKKSNSPTLIHCHGKDVMWDLKKFKTGNPFHSQKYFEKVKEVSNIAYFIANSNSTKNQLLKIGIPDSRIFINYFGIEAKEIVNKNEKSPFKILFLGRLVDFKGPRETIKAFELACERGLKGELLIAGGGELEKECQELAENSKYRTSIKMLGWVDKENAEKLYNSCDVFTAHNKKDINTNQIEAFGVTIIEAMSYGIPVVTGKCGGVEDSIVHGETGYLFEPGDVDTQADYFLELYQNKDLRNELGMGGEKRVNEFFSLEKEKKGLEDIIRKISH